MEEEKRKNEMEAEKKTNEPWLIVQVFRHKPILIRCIEAPVWWITFTVVYYGLSINVVNISGNREFKLRGGSGRGDSWLLDVDVFIRLDWEEARAHQCFLGVRRLPSGICLHA